MPLQFKHIVACLVALLLLLAASSMLSVALRRTGPLPIPRLRQRSSQWPLKAPASVSRECRRRSRVRVGALPFLGGLAPHVAIWSSPNQRQVFTCAAPPSAAAGTQQQEQQFRIMRITGDGSCMFRAAAQGAHIAHTGL